VFFNRLILKKERSVVASLRSNYRALALMPFPFNFLIT